MRIIITGGTGLMGRRLCKMLSSERGDAEIIVLSRSQQKSQPGVTMQTWDGRSAANWGHLIDENTVLVNLAGENPAAGRWTPEHKDRVLQSRLDAAQAIRQAVEGASSAPRALLQASAVGYYGDTADALITEDSPAGDNWRAQVCVDWEAAIAPLTAAGLRTCILRIGIVLDPEGGALPPFLLAGRLMGRQLGDGRQWLPWIHHADAAGAIQFLIYEAAASGIFNLCAPEAVTNAQMMQQVAAQMGRPALVPVPAFALNLAMGEMASTVLDSQRILPQALLNAGYSFRYAQIREALREILA